MAHCCHINFILFKNRNKFCSGPLLPWTIMHLGFETTLNFKMAAGRVRNVNWKDDEKLKEELAHYVRIGLRRNEILSFMERDYKEYAWSIRTLSR